MSQSNQIRPTQSQLLNLRDIQQEKAYRAEISLRSFIRQAWNVVEPSSHYYSNWHIDAICEHLEAVSSGQIRNLLINMPPRSMKSLSVSVFWPMWTWIKNPQIRWMFSSYALQLAIRDSLKCRRVIESDWYKTNWGHVYNLVEDQNLKARFENNKMGYRLAISVDSATTGEGGDFLCCFLENTPISTDKGIKNIGDIVKNRLPVKILSYNHNTRKQEYKHIEEYEKNPGRNCLRVTLSDGKYVDTTKDHPFYVHDKGYVQAIDLKTGDKLLANNSELFCVRERDNKNTSTRKKNYAPFMFTCLSGCVAKRTKQSNVQWGACKAILSSLSKRIFSKKNSISSRWEVLFSGLQRRILQGGELSILEEGGGENKEGIPPRIQNNCQEHTGQRQSRMSIMSFDRKVAQKIVECSSYRFGQIQQRLFKSCNFVQLLSRENAWRSRKQTKMEDVLVKCIESIPTPEYVYNLRIEDNHNYYANNVLVHNCDDAHNVSEATSDLIRNTTLDWWDHAMSSRLNNPRTGGKVIVMQRVHQNDLSGHVLEQGGYIHLNLPAEFEVKKRCVTAIGWSDPRIKEGELLWPDRLPKEVLDGLKKSLGSISYAGQYQQRPMPSEGGQFQYKWFKYFTQKRNKYILESEGQKIEYQIDECWRFMTVDLAISLKQTADYTVICTWAVTPENELLLIARERDRMDNPTQQRVIASIFNSHEVDYIKIESVAYQLSLVQQLRKSGFPIREFKPIKDKVSRATTASVYYEGGSVYHPKSVPWLGEWEEELLLFPNSQHDDQVDNCSMACEEIYTPRRIGGIFFDTSAIDHTVEEARASEDYESYDEDEEEEFKKNFLGISDEEAVRLWR